MMTPYTWCALVAAGAMTSAAAGATRSQDARPLNVEPELAFDAGVLDSYDEWRVEVAPIAWFSAYSGDLTIAPGTDFALEDIDADEPAWAVGADVRVRSDKFAFSLGGAVRNDSGDDVAAEPIRAGSITLAAGDAISWESDITVVKATAGYRFEPLVFDTQNDVRLQLDAYAGLRYVDLSFELEGGGNTASFDENWAMPVFGGRLTLDLPYETSMLIESDIGYLPLGDTTVFAWEAFLGFGWQATPNIGARIGFRHLSLRYLDEGGAGDQEFQGFLAGLYLGAVVRF